MSESNNEESENQAEKLPDHHKKLDYCFTRKAYRKGKRSTAVKVFTVNTESKYLIVRNVHATGLHVDLVKLFSKYGNIVQCEDIKEYPKEPFTQVFLVKFQDIQSARHAKRRTDEMYFFGSTLHVFYAPEHEMPEETRAKLTHRRAVVVNRIRSLKKEANKAKFKDSGMREQPTITKSASEHDDMRQVTLSRKEEGTFANLQSSTVLRTIAIPAIESPQPSNLLPSRICQSLSISSSVKIQKEQLKRNLQEKMKPIFNRMPNYVSPQSAVLVEAHPDDRDASNPLTLPSCMQLPWNGKLSGNTSSSNADSTFTESVGMKTYVQKFGDRKRAPALAVDTRFCVKSKSKKL